MTGDNVTEDIIVNMDGGVGIMEGQIDEWRQRD